MQNTVMLSDNNDNQNLNIYVFHTASIHTFTVILMMIAAFSTRCIIHKNTYTQVCPSAVCARKIDFFIESVVFFVDSYHHRIFLLIIIMIISLSMFIHLVCENMKN